MSIGDTLAEARRRAGLTITQVSQQTRIRETIIRGIERGDFSACGGDFYSRGHIRSIAKVVGTDPDPLIREYDAAHGAPHAIRAAEVFEPSTPISLKERRSPNWSLALVVILALIVGFVIYHAVSSDNPAKAHPAADTGTHPRAGHHRHPSPPPTSPSVASHRQVVIKLTANGEPCWVGFSRVNGQALFNTTLGPYQTKTWTFRHSVTMVLGNPGAVILTVNGRNRSPGNTGTPVTLQFNPAQQLSS